jgi:phosphoglycerol transferase MdoB-like AlkP superfamily enzyme
MFRIFKPIALFMSCILSIVFSLLHPSVLFFALMPVFIYGFFLDQKQYRKIAKFFVIVVAAFILCMYAFNIAVLITPGS